MPHLQPQPPDAGFVVEDPRRAVRVTGADRRKFLDATLSQAVGDLAAGSARSALWLDIHGAPLAAVDIVAPPDDEALLLLTVPEGLPAIVDVLAMRTFLSDAAFEVLDVVIVAVRAMGPGLPARTVEADGDVITIGRDDGMDVVGPRDAVAAWLAREQLGPATIDPDLLSEHEIRQGQPRFGVEIVAPHLPEEAGLLPTHVHLSKGCYPGQEAVARMWMLGKPRRRLVVLDLDRPAEPGDEVGEGRDRFTVTRCTPRSPWAAMAYAPSAVEVGQAVDAEGWSGRVRMIVGRDQDQPGADPAITQRRDRRA